MFKPAFVIAAVLLCASCSSEDEYIYVDKAWVRLPAVVGSPGAAYFTVHGGPVDDTLIRVSAPTAIRAEMHDTVSQGGVMRMTPLASAPVPAKSEVEFKPGGRHVMLYNLRTVKPGGAVRLDFTFASGYQIYVDAAAQPAGAADPHADR